MLSLPIPSTVSVDVLKQQVKYGPEREAIGGVAWLESGIARISYWLVLVLVLVLIPILKLVSTTCTTMEIEIKFGSFFHHQPVLILIVELTEDQVQK